MECYISGKASRILLTCKQAGSAKSQTQYLFSYFETMAIDLSQCNDTRL
jgi:hypothetical protein